MATTDVICDECGGAILASEHRGRGRSCGDVVCADCESDIDAEFKFLCPQDEPVDEGLAYLDRLDRWHGPHHA